MRIPYAKRYAKAIAAIGKPTTIRDTPGIFMVSYPLMYFTVTEYHLEKTVKVEIAWNPRSHSSPAETRQFVTQLSKLTKLASRIERDLAGAKTKRAKTPAVDKQTAGWIGVIKGTRKA